MTAALWVTMALHVGAFAFWMAVGLWTVRHLKKEHEEKTAQMVSTYESAIDNVREISRQANEAYIRNMFRGDDNAPVA